jgi:hypothetical protein
MFENLALVQIIDNCTSASIIAVIRSLLAKIQIFELFDWLKFFEGNSLRYHFASFHHTGKSSALLERRKIYILIS